MSLDISLTLHVTSREVFDRNITHNLGKLANELGIYEHVWRPGDIGIEKAYQLVEPLKVALVKLRANPTKYKEFEPSNGWGTMDGFIVFLEEYIQACHDYPGATVTTHR